MISHFVWYIFAKSRVFPAKAAVKTRLTEELTPSKSWESHLSNINGIFRKKIKLPNPSTCKTPKRNKRNTVNGKAHSSGKVSSNFHKGSPVL